MVSLGSDASAIEHCCLWGPYGILADAAPLAARSYPSEKAVRTSMQDQDFSSDRAMFDAIVQNQLDDFELGFPDDRRIEVGSEQARFIEEAITGLEQQNPCSGFEPLKEKLLRKIWIRDRDA
jgi:hypothetical protein